jgi:hypothetical protein
MHTIASFFSAIIMMVSSWFGISHLSPQDFSQNAGGVQSAQQANIKASDTHMAIAETANLTAGTTSNATSANTSGNASIKTSFDAAISATAGKLLSGALNSLASSIAGSITTSIASDVLPTGSSWLTTLPLGDYKYVTSSPKQGNIYLCNVQSGGQGAQVNGPWIHDATWNPSEKVHVEGNVSWPNATYKMTLGASTRLITSNDLPTDHTTGTFPISASDPAARYDRNQGTIAAHNYSFSLPANPVQARAPGCIYGEVGIMNNGVLLFDGFDALYRDALAHELQDDHDGHPNNEGYHKHGFINDIKNVSVSDVVGFAFDGYPITGPKLPSAKYLKTSDLDECHGMTSDIKLDGKEVSAYHYVLTQDFPYSVSCFHGTSKITPQTLRAQGLETNSVVDAGASLNTNTNVGAGGAVNAGASANGNGGGNGQNNPPAPPAEAISACTGKSNGSSCTVGEAVSGTCSAIGQYFACLPR